MKKLFITSSMALMLSACSGGSDSIVNPEAESGGEPLAGAALGESVVDAALPDPVNTDTLVVSENFSFETARKIIIDFDIPEAVGKDASVSICTEYTAIDPFEVDYNSCPVKTSMTDGQFNHSMEVTNSYEKVVAVVWFTDESQAPIAREFTVEQGATMRSKNGGQFQTIVWN